MSDSEEEETAFSEDPRVQYLGKILCRMLKLKSDTWEKFVNVEKNKILFTTFFETRIRLIFQRDRVCLLLLSNKKNHQMWPNIISQDVRQHIENLQSKVTVVRGQCCGKTVLPFPAIREWIEHCQETTITLYEWFLCVSKIHAIESMVISWTHMIHKVLRADSADLTVTGLNPGPKAELDFWSARKTNIQSIHEQLQNPCVQKMMRILEIIDSSYFPSFNAVTEAEARAIDIHLQPLRSLLSQLEENEFSSIYTLIPPVFHLIFLVWTHCSFYRSPARIVALQPLHSKVAALASHYSAPKCWDFPSALVFSRFDDFLARVLQLKFQRLEKLVFGGLRGRVYTEQVSRLHTEFLQFCKNIRDQEYNPLDLTALDFEKDFSSFQERVADFDRRLSCILCLALQDCSGLESVFKVRIFFFFSYTNNISLYLLELRQEKALQYQDTLNRYSPLWLDDSVEFLRQFLLCGHALTAEMVEAYGEDAMQFKEQVKLYTF
uniref:Dynein heavy chain tail domain-containing protein n=1 Tax=Sinocyclocheilus rhinocerous TaxID=307959 RepID=A0A673J6L0_9TELE